MICCFDVSIVGRICRTVRIDLVAACETLGELGKEKQIDDMICCSERKWQWLQLQEKNDNSHKKGEIRCRWCRPMPNAGKDAKNVATVLRTNRHQTAMHCSIRVGDLIGFWGKDGHELTSWPTQTSPSREDNTRQICFDGREARATATFIEGFQRESTVIRTQKRVIYGYNKNHESFLQPKWYREIHLLDKQTTGRCK